MTVEQAFPGAIPVEDYVKRTYDACLSHGLVSEKTLAMVGVCRDELTDGLTEPLRAAWGSTFRMGSLGGMLFLGGPTLFPLVFAMVFGIIVGTYSSIYVALPIILVWGAKRGDDEATPLPARP